MTASRGIDSTAVLTLPDAPTPGDDGPLLSTPADEAEYAAGRRSVARTMWIGGWIWPSYTLLDIYMCFVAFPKARFTLFLLYRLFVELAFIAVYRASIRGT